jgi:thiol-disulfide isomerase/thioredoxin
MKTLRFPLTLFLISIAFYAKSVLAQTIGGRLAFHPNQTITLYGFKGFETFLISETYSDAQGRFLLTYPNVPKGGGILRAGESKPYIVLLNGEDIELFGETFAESASVKVLKGEENRQFAAFARTQPIREQALSALHYLEGLYNSDSLLMADESALELIQSSKLHHRSEAKRFIESLPESSYVKWFLPVRKLISAVPLVAQYRSTEIAETIVAFRKLNYADQRLYSSGLLREAVESHFWLIENSGRSLDSVFSEMRVSIDILVRNLENDQKKFNEIINYLFDLLERHSLFDASEYLAIRVLQESSCTLETDLARQLETYRAMKKGNIAPDVIFKGDFFLNGNPAPQKVRRLSDFSNEFKVIVFGASWCPKCTEEVPEIARLYPKWKANGVEVVFISLDDNPADFKTFTNEFPFLSFCDYKKWQGSVVEQFYVFATPSMFLLNKNHEILLRPHSVKQMDAWVEWYLVQGNLR